MSLRSSAIQAKEPFPGHLLKTSTRPYSLTLVEQPKYLHALIEFETISHEKALICLAEIADQCVEFGDRRLILERDTPLMLPLTDIFFAYGDLVQTIKGIRVALVNPFHALDDQMELIALIANSRGASVSVHQTITDAERWLEEDTSPAN